MIRLLHLLIFGHYCVHQWKILGRGPIAGRREDRVSGHYYNLQCVHCGKIKGIKIT